jgi:hypothetical protein
MNAISSGHFHRVALHPLKPTEFRRSVDFYRGRKNQKKTLVASKGREPKNYLQKTTLLTYDPKSRNRDWTTDLCFP